MFSVSDEELLIKFNSLKTNDDLADLLEMKKSSLLFFAYSRKSFYHEFEIPKKNGKTRIILAPCKQLKTIQKKIAYVLSIVYKPKKNVYGFIKKRGILNNAKIHEGKREVLSIDLSDYFYQFHFGRVRGMLMNAPYNIGEEAANTLANLLCVKIVYPDGTKSTVLPQGAPTSPIISNMICKPFDNAMIRYAKANSLVYSRYADDIVLSSDDSILSNRIVSNADGGNVVLENRLIRIFQINNLRINDEKTRLKKYYQRQMVTGVIVNDHANIKREYIREVRSILFHCERDGVYRTAQEYCKMKHFYIIDDEKRTKEWFKRIIVGKITYIGYITEKKSGAYYCLASKANKVFGESTFDISNLYNEKDIANKNVFIIEDDLGNRQGTAFIVPGCGVFTCNHVLEKENIHKYHDAFSFYSEKGKTKRLILSNISFDKEKNPFDSDLDFALFLGLDSEFPESKRIKIGDSDNIDIGDNVVLIGYPEYATGTYTRIKTAITKKGRHLGHPLYSVSHTIIHGFSGGIVIDNDNKVVGIVSAGIASTDLHSEKDLTEKVFGFIPINCVRDYIREKYDIDIVK